MIEYDTVAEFWRKHVPAYQSKALRPLLVKFPYAGVRAAAKRIARISERRSNNRITNYLDPPEIERVRRKIHGLPPPSKNSGGADDHSDDASSSSSRNSTSRPRKDVSIRFGVKKEGQGYSGERGDFCLVGGVYSYGTLTLFYRSIELIGGFAYDLVLIKNLVERLEIEPKFVEIWATKAFVFALKGNSNEKLYPKLKEIFRERIRESGR